jgi:tetratricopeptide (TPR) repeat protein
MRSVQPCTRVIWVLIALVPPSLAEQQRPAASQPASQAVTPACGRSLFEAGCQKLRAGDTATAVELLRRAVAKYPERSDYALKLAEAYTLAGQPEAAQRLLENLRALRPREVSINLALARIHARRHAWQAVADTLAPLEHSLQADGVVLLGRAYRQMGDHSRATATIRRGLQRFENDERLWLALIDTTLERESYTLALRWISEATRQVGPSPQLHFRAAQAFFHLGQALGPTAVRDVPGGRAGQFCGRWLLSEKRAEPHRFLCCPKNSALYQLRRALDAGLDEPEAHLLHALIWQQAGRPTVGFAVLKSREAVLVESADPATMAVFARLALDADALSDFLRYARLRAQRQPEQRDQIMAEAYLAVAERYNERGDNALYAAYLRRALELRPDDAKLVLRLADADWAAERHHDAILGYRRVLEQDLRPAEKARILERLAAWQERHADVP